MNDNKNQDYMIELRELLASRFNTGEMKTLCFDMGVDYENLPGEGKADKARELVSYCDRHKCLDKLVQAGQRLRPDIQWQAPAVTEKHGPSLPASIAGNGNVIGNGNVVQIIKAEGGSNISGVTQIGGDVKRKKRKGK